MELWHLPCPAAARPVRRRVHGAARPYHRKWAVAVTILLSGPTSLLAALLILLLAGALWGPERIYQRMLELIRVLRDGGSSQNSTTPPNQDADRPWPRP